MRSNEMAMENIESIKEGFITVAGSGDKNS